MRFGLLTIFAGLIATPLFAEQPGVMQVLINVSVLSGPRDLLQRPAIKQFMKGDEPHCCFVLSAKDAQCLVATCKQINGVKLLAEPKLVTLSGRPARFVAGGQQALVGPASGVNGPGIAYRDVGTELDFLPIVKRNGRIYLEARPSIRMVNHDRGIQTEAGWVPGFDERSMNTAVELGMGEAFVTCQQGDDTTLFVIEPEIIDFKPAAKPTKSPVEERAAKMAAKLMQKYYDACANGEAEKARKYAREALDLDPECFASSRAQSLSNERRMEGLHEGSENLKQVRDELRRIWFTDQPSNLTPQRTSTLEERNIDLRIPAPSPIRDPNAPPRCEEEPTDDEVLRALPKRFDCVNREDVEIVFEKMVDTIDPPRFWPKVGYRQMHHCHWKCTVYFTDTLRTESPVPMVVKRKRVEVVYVDKNVLRPANSDAARELFESSPKVVIQIEELQTQEPELRGFGTRSWWQRRRWEMPSQLTPQRVHGGIQ